MSAEARRHSRPDGRRARRDSSPYRLTGPQSSKRSPLGGVTLPGRVVSEPFTVAVSIPAGVSVARFSLDWRHDWTAFPVSDLDMYVTDPNGAVYFDCVTLDAPEVRLK